MTVAGGIKFKLKIVQCRIATGQLAQDLLIHRAKVEEVII
jgi:hypothetical protein